MQAIQLVILAGAAFGIAVWFWFLVLLPTYPNLRQSLALLDPMPEPAQEIELEGWEVVGAWGLKKLPEKLRPIPSKDLALLGITPAGFLARKLAFALVGLLFPPVVTAVLVLAGMGLPWVAPAFVSLITAVLAFMVPDLDVRQKASKARREFSRTLACYVDLVAMERACGSGTKQALDVAAEVGDSWAFHRLRESLDFSTWAGRTGWDGLRSLANDLDLTDLSDVADIIRLSGSEGAGIYRILRANARSMREGILLRDLTRANETNEKMSLPVSVLGIVFLAILIAPGLLSVMGG